MIKRRLSLALLGLIALHPSKAQAAPYYFVVHQPPVVLVKEGYKFILGNNYDQIRRIKPLTTDTSARVYSYDSDFYALVQSDGAATSAIKSVTMEVGYQVACGIVLGKDGVELKGNLGITSQMNPGVTTGATIQGNNPNGYGLGEVKQVEQVPMSLQGTIKFNGQFLVTKVADTKEVKGSVAHVRVHKFGVSVDQCVGQSFTRSYALLSVQTSLDDFFTVYIGKTVND